MSDSFSETLSMEDAAWLHAEEATSHFVVTSLSLLEEPIELGRFERMLARRIGLHPRLRQIVAPAPLGLGPPRWVPAPNFDLRAHVHRVSLAAPGGRRELEDFVGDLVGRGLDFERPLWEVHLVDGAEVGRAIVTRIHHSLGDGQALVRMLLSLTDDAPDGWRSAVKRRAPAAREGQDGPARLLRAMAGLAASVDRVPEAARWGAAAAGTFGRLTLLDPDKPTPLRGRLSLLKRVSWSDPVPLPFVKRIAASTGTTVNDVVVSAIAGALGKYLRRLGEDTSGLRIRAMVPVNLRSPKDAETAGNMFSLVFLDLPVGALQPWERLMRVKIEMDRIKASNEPVVAWLMLRGMGLLPVPLERRMASFYASKASLVLTNVIGPDHRVFLAGSPIREMTFWEPESGGLAVGVSIYSYADQVTVGVVSDDNVISKPSVITDGWMEAFLELAKAAGVPPPAGPRKRQTAATDAFANLNV